MNIEVNFKPLFDVKSNSIKATRILKDLGGISYTEAAKIFESHITHNNDNNLVIPIECDNLSVIDDYFYSNDITIKFTDVVVDVIVVPNDSSKKRMYFSDADVDYLSEGIFIVNGTDISTNKPITYYTHTTNCSIIQNR